MIFSTKPNHQETICGCLYLIVDFLILPSLLSVINTLLPSPLSSVTLNVLYYFINFALILLIFRKYLLQAVKDALRVPLITVVYAVLTFLGNMALSHILTLVLSTLFPGFSNINDLKVSTMLQANFPIMAAGIVLLVPLAEETLFRGLIFRGLYDRSPVAAYLVSMTAFATIHVMGYFVLFDPLFVLLNFLQYLPAGYCLCFAYRRSGTIISPILMHMIVNAVAAFSMR